MPRVLVIEDDANLRSLLREVLQSAHHMVSEAANGREGLMELRRESFELVVTDMLMPEMEGVETIRAIQREFPAVKIIAISGGGVIASNHLLSIAERLRVAKTLAKPFQPDEFLTAVNETLK